MVYEMIVKNVLIYREKNKERIRKCMSKYEKIEKNRS